MTARQPREGIIHCPLPSCGGVMVRRVNRAIHREFMGCDQSPVCTETMPMPESVWMRQVGVPELPGFETEGAK